MGNEGSGVPDWAPDSFKQLVAVAEETRKICLAPAFATARTNTEHQHTRTVSDQLRNRPTQERKDLLHQTKFEARKCRSAKAGKGREGEDGDDDEDAWGPDWPGRRPILL